jgi:fibronectin type 3 domain-containing protein
MKRLFLWFLLLFPVSISATTLPLATTHYVELMWQAGTDQTDPTTGYNVHRALNGGSFSVIATENSITSTLYDDGTVQYTLTYQYYITALDAQSNESVPSNTVTVTIPFVPYTPVIGSLVTQ